MRVEKHVAYYRMFISTSIPFAEWSADWRARARERKNITVARGESVSTEITDYLHSK
jgi:hypothetical protein